jgi:SAM-dependent methyltransferase
LAKSLTASDLSRWEKRWRDRVGPPSEPEPALVDAVGELRPGRVLDVAAGDGRNALWLATRGFDVTAVDIAPAASARLEVAAGERSLTIAAVVADLDEPGRLGAMGRFANLVVVRFRPSPAQWAALLDLLVPRGRLFLCSFRLAQHEVHGFPLAYCLDRAELTGLFEPRLRLLWWREIDQEADLLAASLWEIPAGAEG